MSALKTPCPYYGGKVSLARRIVGLLPPHKTYVEPFFGSGAVFFAKRPSVHEVLNDRDGAVVAFWRCVRDRLPELERACLLTPYARDEHASAVLAEDLDELELARRFWVKVTQSFGHSVTAGYAYAIAQNTARTRSVLASLGRFAPACERLQGAAIENTEALRLVERFRTSDVVIYLDPTYDEEARVSGDDYRHEMTEDDHRALAAGVADTDAAVIVSGYTSPLYEDLYDGWHRVELPAIHAARTEVLWSNRVLASAPPELFGAPA